MRFIGHILVCWVISNSPAQADSYQCTFKPRHVEKGLVPATLRIDWPNFLKPAHITDTITKANGLLRVRATVPIENSKRITFAWQLDNIFVPNIDRLTGDRISRVNVSYRASIFPASGKVVLSIHPMVRIGYTNSDFRAEGRCKILR